MNRLKTAIRYLLYGEFESDQSPDHCSDHNFSDWEFRDRERDNHFDPGDRYRDYAHEVEEVAVKYKRNGDGGVDRRDPRVVPYEDVQAIWCALSGNKYALVTIYKEAKRECHCDEYQLKYRPYRYMAIYCDEVIATSTDRSEINDAMVEHDRD